jgi:branched-chain amino acid transport system permease protein
MDNLQILFSAPIFSLQLLIDGLLIGAIFALAAYGMALVWGVMKIINFAQGEFVILGGYMAFAFSKAGVHPFLSVPLATVVLYIVGWLLHRLVIFRIVEKDLFISILATFGISILMQQCCKSKSSALPPPWYWGSALRCS